jgi:hypothetical protein
MRETLDSIIAFEEELRLNSAIQLVTYDFFNSPANSGQIESLQNMGKVEKTVLDFYRVSDGFEINWRPVDISFEEHEMFGRVKINPFQRVVRNWSGVVYFDDEPENSPRRKFFPLDFFADEAAAGFCSLEGYRNMMFLFRFEGDLIPLYVNFENYLKCLLATKGCLYWQYLIVELISGAENEMSSRIKRFLPQLFPDFGFHSFEELFNDVRIKQRKT